MSTDAMRPLSSTPSGSTARLGASLHIKGEISGNEDLHIDGSVEGLVQLEDRKLTVGASAKLTADVVAREVVVYGSVKGNLRARDRIEIKKDGSVVGDLTTARIMIEDGAYFKGSIEIDRTGSKKRQRPRQARVHSHCHGFLGDSSARVRDQVFQLSQAFSARPRCRAQSRRTARRSASRLRALLPSRQAELSRLFESGHSYFPPLRLGRGTTLISSLRADPAGAGSTLLSKPGATLQCSPESVITVTVFLLYCVKIPTMSGLPPGLNFTRSPIRKSSMALCDRIWLRNRSRATIL